MRSQASVTITTSGVLGGWLAIMAPAVIIIALRMREFDPSGLPVLYSATLAAGWAMMIVALIVFGRVGDVLRRRTGSRVALARVGAPLIALAGALLALAPSPGWLLMAWVFAQLPSAMVITTALAEAGEVVPVGRRGLASGMIGAASIIALLIGSAIATALSSSPAWAFLVTSLLGTLFALPLAMSPVTAHALTEDAAEEQAPAVASPSALTKAAWPIFVIASLLLSWAASTTNGFVVPYVQNVADVAQPSITGLSSWAILTASVLATITSIAGGMIAGGRRRGAWMWSIAATACAAGLLVLLIAPTTVGVLIAAALFGAGFGLANGVELGVVLLLRTDPSQLGRDLGLFTAATSGPYVLVPALATLLLSYSVTTGLVQLFTLALALALTGSLLVLSVGRRLPADRQRRTAPQA